MSSIQSWARHRFGEKAAVGAVTVVAAFLRFYRLDQIPPGFQFDQAFYVFDSLRLLQGQFSVFFTAPGESEPLYPYLAMVGVAVFGPNTPLGLKITSAVLGLVTIPVIYIFAREMFRSARIGLLAGAFAAISTWHIFYSRDGERLTLLVLLATLTFLYLWRTLDRRRRRDCILTGLFLGLSLYTYPASRILPIAVTLIMAFAAWQDRMRMRDYFRCFAFVLAVTALVYMPLGVHYILHPDTFISHTAQVSIFASNTNLVHALSDNAVRLFNMFVIQGDGGMIRNVPGRPIFDPLSGTLFVLGVFFFFSALILPRAGPVNRLRALVVGTWIGLALALSLFSDDAPNFGRILVAFPAVMIIPAWGAGAAWEAIRNPTVRRAGGVALAAMIVGSGALAYHDYFITFGNAPALYISFDGDKVEIADWINANAGSHHIFLAPLYYQQGTISLLTHATRVKSFDSRDSVVLPASYGQDAIFAFPPEQEKRVQTMAARLGSLGTRDELRGRDGELLLSLIRVTDADLPGFADPLSALARGGPFVRPGQTLQAGWNDQIRLLGYTATGTGPGQRNLAVTVFMQALKPMGENYSFSLKVRDSRGRVWGQEDKFAGDNSYPTLIWDVGDVIAENFYPGLDACAPAGQYSLTVEAYDPKTGLVLPLAGSGETVAKLGMQQAGPSEGNRLQDLQPDKAQEVQVAAGMKLLGWSITPTQVPTGSDLGLALFWQGAGDKGVVRPVSIRLRDVAGAKLELATGSTPIPAAGRAICAWYDLKVPQQAAAGTAHIAVNGVEIDSVELTR